MRSMFLVTVLVVGCRNTDKIEDTVPADDTGPVEVDDTATDDTVVEPDDLDGDGFAADVDCDDGDPGVHPDATETCDGVDQDCDGEVDEDATDAATWYTDSDGDTYGDAAAARVACEPAEGEVERGGDCDDGDAAISPDAVEVCDGVDQDCDGEVDDGVTLTVYQDGDGDGYGDEGQPAEACAPSEGWSAQAGDCDDGDAAVSPAASELCNGVDGPGPEDCDSSSDEDATDAATWYADSDSDGYGDANSAARSCVEPTGYVADDTTRSGGLRRRGRVGQPRGRRGL